VAQARLTSGCQHPSSLSPLDQAMADRPDSRRVWSVASAAAHAQAVSGHGKQSIRPLDQYTGIVGYVACS